jgi:acetyl esterase/lipase
VERVVEPAAIPIVNRLAEECIESVYDIILRQRTAGPLERSFLSVQNPLDLEPWQSLAASNTPGALPSGIPVFLSHGADDNLVRPEVTKDYMTGLCLAGSNVQMVFLPGVNHGFIARDSARAAVDWMADRFGNLPAPNQCSNL